ncbi:hypothetical protein HJFPF1_13213 [Paramyrothecium foliicola]|nr:hypothetical protein HJFPF1_13213 [Paramyrothecium foliicola]
MSEQLPDTLKDSGDFELLDDLFHGHEAWTIEKAHRAVDAFKALWPSSSAPPTLEPTASIFLQLAQALRQDCCPIPERATIERCFYRQFITYFDRMCNVDDHTLKSVDTCLLVAYKAIIGDAADREERKPVVAVRPEDSEKALLRQCDGIIQKYQAVSDFIQKEIDKRRMECPSNLFDPSSESLERVLAAFHSAVDEDGCHAAGSDIEKIIQQGSPKALLVVKENIDTKILSFKNLIKATVDPALASTSK